MEQPVPNDEARVAQYLDALCRKRGGSLMDIINLRESKGFHVNQADMYGQLLTQSIVRLETELQRDAGCDDPIALDYIIQQLTTTLEELKKKR